MFADYNSPFAADQARTGSAADYAMAAGGADQLLTELGVAFHALPYYFRIDPATHQALGEATEALANAQDKLLRELCATKSADELTAMFQVPPAMAPLLDWTTMADSRFRMMRADIIPTAAGYYFCELNHFSGVGGGEGYHSAKIVAELLGRSVGGVSPFRELAYLYVSECRRAGLARVVVLDSAEHRKQGFGEHRLLQQYLRLMAPDLEIAYCDELTYPAEWLGPDEASRTLVHRLITLDDTTDGGAFLLAIRDSGATVSCMFEAELKMHRKWFAMLCDPRYHHLFDEREVAVIKQYLPHTFELSQDNYRQALADKDSYVFKSSYTYGGKGVLLGAHHSREELLDALLSYGVEAWTCQQYVPTTTVDLPSRTGESVPHYVVLGMFGYGQNLSGLLVRAMPRSEIVNVSQGGGVSWAFVE